LGDARDRDVQVSWLMAAIARLPQAEFSAGVARVLDRCQRKREKLQPKVLAGINALSSTRALHQMLIATKKMLPDGKKGDLLTPSPELLDRAERQVLARLEQFLALKGCLADPNDHQRHHTMRIAGKQLRYTVEIYRPLYAGRIDAVLNAMKQLQTLFGDLHDCDVWIEQLAQHRDKQSKRIARLFGHAGPFARLEAGIRYLEEDRSRCRREIFQTLVEYWGSQAGLWDELTRIVHSREQIPPVENRLTVHCD
jgi:CHAD domain-containing protein